MNRLQKLRLLFLRTMQRLRRSIWLRRLKRLTKLTEKQLRIWWRMEKEYEIAKEGRTLANLLTPMPSEYKKIKAELPLLLYPTEENLEAMEDLQAASRQLTSMLTSSRC